MSAPQFLSQDPAQITADLISAFQTSSGRVLYPAQPERLLIDLLAYRETLLRQDIQATAEQNLVAYATGTNLELLGQLVGVTRLSGIPATVTIRFSLSSLSGSDTPIPSGTRVADNTSTVSFATTADGVITAGDLYADMTLTAQVPGILANGFAPGSLAQMLDVVAGVTAANTSTSSGGVDFESDEALRRRIILAPSAFGTAGSPAAYKFWALSTGPWMADALVSSPTGGQVQVAILTTTGAPTTSQRNAVTASLSAPGVAPISDRFTVVSANALSYVITANLTILSSADPTTVLNQALAAAQSLRALRLRTLGMDITLDQIRAALFVPGVYSISLTHPTANLVAGVSDFCSGGAITLSIAGTVDG